MAAWSHSGVVLELQLKICVLDVPLNSGVPCPAWGASRSSCSSGSLGTLSLNRSGPRGLLDQPVRPLGHLYASLDGALIFCESEVAPMAARQLCILSSLAAVSSFAALLSASVARFFLVAWLACSVRRL